MIDSQLVIERPSLLESSKLIDRSLKKKVIFLVGECRVNYRGRANSTLTCGERFVVIKKDMSILVHRPKGYEPVNWQPPGSIIRVRTSKKEIKNDIQVERLEINSLRRKPIESLKIVFNNIYFIGVFNLLDSGEFSLYASEEDMQKAIVSHPELIESGFRVMAYEKQVEPGFVDVYGIDKNGRFVVIEIKRKTAGKTAVLQLERYINAIKNLTTNKIRAILVAPKIAKGVQQLITTLGIEFKQLDPKKCAEILNQVIKENKLDSYV